MANNITLNKIKNELSILGELIQSENFKEGDNSINKLTTLYNEYKNDCELKRECINFGTVNHIFESNLLDCFKTNKKVIKEYINAVKSDKNLLSQYNFMQALKNKPNNTDTYAYVNEALNLLHENVDQKTIQKSNNVLINIINKYGLKPKTKINEDAMCFYKAFDQLVKHKKSLSNLKRINESIAVVSSFTSDNFKQINESKDVNTLIQDFTKKLDSFNVTDKKIVEDLIAITSKNSTNPQQALFEQVKNKCMEIIDDLYVKSNESDKIKLTSLREQIYQSNCIDTDPIDAIVKMYDVQNVLLDN